MNAVYDFSAVLTAGSAFRTIVFLPQISYIIYDVRVYELRPCIHKRGGNGMSYSQFCLTDEQIRKTRITDHRPKSPKCNSQAEKRG